MLNGFLLLLVFQCLGEAIKAYTQVVLPGPIIGMLLLLAALCLYRKVPDSLGQASQQLIQHLGLMFLPPSAGLFFLAPRFNAQWPAIVTAMIIGTLLSLVFSGLLMQWLVGRKQQ